jgi:hypothetical protein
MQRCVHTLELAWTVPGLNSPKYRLITPIDCHVCLTPGKSESTGIDKSRSLGDLVLRRIAVGLDRYSLDPMRSRLTNGSFLGLLRSYSQDR